MSSHFVGKIHMNMLTGPMRKTQEPTKVLKTAQALYPTLADVLTFSTEAVFIPPSFSRQHRTPSILFLSHSGHTARGICVHLSWDGKARAVEIHAGLFSLERVILKLQ